MSIQQYMGGEDAIVAYQREEITPEERERRQKEAEELEVKLKFINEKVPSQNVQMMGSVAGAGSGTFHDYRLARRREQDRQKRIDVAWEEQAEEQAYEVRAAQRKAEDEARTAKRRAKRLKKKGKKKVKGADGAAQGGGSGDDGSSDSDAAPGGGAALD